MAESYVITREMKLGTYAVKQVTYYEVKVKD